MASPGSASPGSTRIHGLADLAPALFRRPVAALGVFDGVHRGHAAVLAEAAALARSLGGEAVAVTFDVHPRQVVEGRGPGLLTSVPHRLRLLAAAGAEACVVLRFDPALRELTPERFLEEVLVGRMGIAGLVLGPDSRYGKDRRGDTALARALLEPRGIPVRPVARVAAASGPVSSSAIRDAVRAGDLDRAADLLGRPPSVTGIVVRGDGRGRTLGIPTANVAPAHDVLPRRGVYAGRADLPGRADAACLVNVGGRPTFHAAGAADTVEAWFPGWEGDLYGREIELRFLKRLRDERRFEGPEALRAQIHADRAAMDAWIRAAGGGAGADNGGSG